MTLKEAKRELSEAWIPGEGYDYDQMFVVCYKDGTVLDTRETNKKLSIRNIIGIQFFGSDGEFSVGQELYRGKLIEL